MTHYKHRPRHLLLGKDGKTGMTACGFYAPWHRGLGYVVTKDAVTCGNCKKWMRSQLENSVVTVA